MKYLRGTIDLGIVFQAGDNDEDWVLSGCSDADLAGDLPSSRTTTGYDMKIGRHGTLVSRCTLERKICSSTGQAETYALLGLVKDTEWMRSLLADLGEPQSSPTKLAVDNDGVFKQSKKQINHTTAKHYRIAHAYIRNSELDGVSDVGQVNTEDNRSDMYTKALAARLFVRHRDRTMGPQTPEAL